MRDMFWAMQESRRLVNGGENMIGELQIENSGVQPTDLDETRESSALLQPRNPFQILKQAVHLYRHHWLDFIPIAGLILLVGGLLFLPLVLGFFYLPASFDTWLPLRGIGTSVSGLLVLLFVQAFVTAGVTLAIAASYRGHSPALAQIFRRLFTVKGRLAAFLGASLLLISLVTAFGLIPLIGWLLAPGLLVFLAALVGLGACIVVIERQSGVWVVVRAWELARQHFLRVLTVMVLLGLLVLWIELPAWAITGWLSGFTLDQTMLEMSGFLIRLFLALSYAPLFAICWALLYFDLRVRREGFDGKMLADNLTLAGDEPLYPVTLSQIEGLMTTDMPVPTNRQKLITFKELGKLALTTGGILALLIGVVVGIFFWPYLKSQASERIHTAMTMNTVAPDFTLTNLKDRPVTLSHHRGKPTIVNFWATWCPPCNAELPVLQAAYANHYQELNLLAVSVREAKSTVDPFARQKGLNFPILLDPEGSIAEQYQVRAYPTTLFLDGEGRIVSRHVGALDEATLATYLEPLLEEAESVTLSAQTE